MKEVADFASALQVAVKTLQIYTAEHPRTAAALDTLERATAELFNERSRITLTASDGVLLVDGDPLVPATNQTKSLAIEFEKRHVGGVVVSGMAQRFELLALARVMALRPEQVRAKGGAETILRDASVVNIRTTTVRYEAVHEDEEVVASKRIRRGPVSGSESPAGSVSDLLQQYLLSKLKATEITGVAGSGGAGIGTGPGPGAGGHTLHPGSSGATGSGGPQVGAGGASTGSSGGGPATGSGGSAPAGSAGGSDGAWYGFGVAQTGGEGSGSGAGGGFEGTLAKALRGDGGETPTVERATELLSGAIGGLDLLTQLAVLVSVDRLAPGPERDALKGASSTLLAGLGGGGTDNRPVREGDLIAALVTALDQSAEDHEQLSSRMAQLGVTRDQIRDALAVVSWDKLPLDERLAQTRDRERLFEVPGERILRIFRELIAEGRTDELMQLLERYIQGVEHEQINVRETVFETLGLLATTEGLPRDAEQLLGRTVLNHFVRVDNERLRPFVVGATANFILALVTTGRADVALRVIERFDAAVSVAPPRAAIRTTLESLEETLADDGHSPVIVSQIGLSDAESLNNLILPLVTRLGRTMSPQLISALGNEEDRSRRGRLVRALKAVGSPAYPAILDALREDAWYLVRNALNVLADIGTPEHVAAIGQTLSHGDARVRRAAVRALGKVGGVEAERLLRTTLADRNTEVLIETLLSLGALKSDSAIEQVSELARARIGADEKIREAAVNALGHIGSGEAVPVLGEILRPKGIFARESAEMRTAAARALGAIGTAAAKDVLKSAAGSESDRALKELIGRLAD